MLQIIQKRKIWFTISGALVLASIVSFLIWGLNWGIDFTGGSLLEIEFSAQGGSPPKDGHSASGGENMERPASQAIKEKLEPLGLGGINLQPVGERGLIIRMKDIDEKTHQEILSTIEQDFEIEEKRFDSIGPVIGQELKTKTSYAIIGALIAIVLYIAWVFRKVSEPVQSWKYGVAAVIALFHDILITVGAFAVLGKFMQVEVDAPFVAALLTILGYSINDTIVVFDRMRENLPKSRDDFETTFNRSVNETIPRSINTSLTTILVLAAIFFFGGLTIKYFVLALIIGIFLGTYSSIFIASPLLVSWEHRRR